MNGENTGMYMPVVPQGFGNGGFGFGGDNTWWIIILLIFMGGWGNGWAGNGNGGINGDLQRGFDQASLTNGINGLTAGMNNGFTNIQTALCNGFAGVANGFAQAEIAANSRQMADMNQQFAMQTALQNCCCENRSGLADLKYTVATENCADRTAAMQNTRDIIDSNNRNTQAIIDKLCALELDGVKNQLAEAQRENVGLQNQLNMAVIRESQTAQNSLIQQGFSNEVDQLYNRLNSCPVPTTPVYGRTPIFTCGQNGYGGCNCGAA